ncbi:GIY-YIG nuclease family protein [Sphingomonas sp. PvP056]|uniref:GIY-YIG nuclease family protein n=1 Tax=Sphingomonas sp. PvP056 TaxID=3156392 RepID=UPI0033964E17
MIDTPAAGRLTLTCIQPFGDAIEGIDASFRRLLACEPITFDTRPRRLPSSVVYLFSDRDQAIYVGRSNKFRQRLGNHCLHGSQTNQASLAFSLACKDVQHIRTKYRRGSSGADELKEVPGLAEAFSRMKQRLRAMEVRYVEELDQVRQALLEMYAALALETKHDFGTH